MTASPSLPAPSAIGCQEVKTSACGIVCIPLHPDPLPWQRGQSLRGSHADCQDQSRWPLVQRATTPISLSSSPLPLPPLFRVSFSSWRQKSKLENLKTRREDTTEAMAWEFIPPPKTVNQLLRVSDPSKPVSDCKASFQFVCIWYYNLSHVQKFCSS